MAGDRVNGQYENEIPVDFRNFRFDDINLPPAVARQESDSILSKRSSAKVNALYEGEPIVVQLSRAEIFNDEKRVMTTIDFEIFKGIKIRLVVELGVNIDEQEAKCTMFLKKMDKDEMMGIGQLLYAKALDFMQGVADWLKISFTDYAKHDSSMGLTKKQWVPLFKKMLESKGYTQSVAEDEESAGTWQKTYNPKLE